VRPGTRKELELQTALGGALIPAKGWAAAEAGRAYARARELCEALGDTARLFPVLWWLTVYELFVWRKGTVDL
jgi:predicted ATPase